MSFGTRLQELRVCRNLTQEELAEKMDVTRQTVSRWETDVAYPDLKKIVQLSDFLNVSTDYLLKSEEGFNRPETSCKVLNKLVGKTVKISFYSDSEPIWDDKRYSEKVLEVGQKNMTVLLFDRKKQTEEERMINIKDIRSVLITEDEND